MPGTSTAPAAWDGACAIRCSTGTTSTSPEDRGADQGGEKAGVALDIGSNVLAAGATAGTVAGMVVGGTTLAAAGSAATFAGLITVVGLTAGLAAAAVALTGPIAACVGAFIGLVILAKSTYSNREGAHKKVTKHCWSLVGTNPPADFQTQEELFDACSAALTLLANGTNQIAQLSAKVDSAAGELKKLNLKLKANEDAIASYKGQVMTDRIAQTVMKLKEDSDRRIKEGKKRGGAIHQFTRRMVHSANYIQAAAIVSVAMQERFAPGHSVGKGILSERDFFRKMPDAAKIRQMFTLLAKFYEDVQAAPGASATTAGDKATARVGGTTKTVGADASWRSGFSAPRSGV